MGNGVLNRLALSVSRCPIPMIFALLTDQHVKFVFETVQISQRVRNLLKVSSNDITVRGSADPSPYSPGLTVVELPGPTRSGD